MRYFIVFCLSWFVASCQTKLKKHQQYPVQKTEQEWKNKLSDISYYVLRKSGTERAFTGKYYNHHEEGVYTCIACNYPLYASEHKFDSGTGWPSFTQPIKENAIKYIKDESYGMIRVETLCNTCNAHLGHVFPDGPEPSGLRSCIISATLQLDTNE